MLENDKFFQNETHTEERQKEDSTVLLEYLFKVKKLGKKRISHKPRLLHITKDGIYYYVMINKNKTTQDFLESLKSLSTNIVGNEIDEKKFASLIQKFHDLPDDVKKLKYHFENYEVEPTEKISGFEKFPVKITNYDAIDEEKDNPINYWIMETYNECFYQAILNAKEKIADALKNENSDEVENDLTNSEDLGDEDSNENKNKENNKKREFEEKDKIHYIELMYQKIMKEYFDLIKRNNRDKEETIKQQLYLELNLYYCYRLFVKHCEKIVKKIIYDLSTFEKADNATFQKKLHPIVFPNPYYFSQEYNAVLLYSIWGVNYTVTWNYLKSPFKSQNKPFSKGKWKGLKFLFKQKDYFQDFISKLASAAEKADFLPSVPMCCVIDYNGFRVLCESDIIATEESIEGYKLKMAQIGQQNALDSSFVKDLSKLISGPCIENNNIIYDISPKDISDEKNFDLLKYYESVNRDFEMSFERRTNYNENMQPNQTSEIKYDKNEFIQTEKQFLKCVKKIFLGDKQELSQSDLIFGFAPSNDNINSISFNYLMFFDILIPDRTFKNQEYKNYYRQEIVLSRINIEYSEEKEQEVNKTETRRMASNQLTTGNVNTEMDNIIKSKEKEKEQLLLNVIKNNTYQNNPRINGDIEKEFNKKLDCLLTALDSLYLVPYNSETLKMSFHYYGINLHYLGKVAERTTVPHIRELCLIEMFARVCKKIVFDLLAQSTFDKAMGTFYAQIKELTTTLNKVPVSFNLLYGNEYLKSITQPVERGKFPTYNGVEVTGLYLLGDEYPLKEQKDNKEKKDINDIENNQVKFQSLSNFFTILFAEPNTKVNFELYGHKMNTTQDLWNYIMDVIREKFEVENEDVFMYCKIETMSIFALVSSIQYHTGIKFQNGLTGMLEKAFTQKFDTAVFDSITPSTKTTYYSFYGLLCKKYTILPLTNNFSMYYPSNLIYYEAKLNYYAEKYLYKKKISQNYYYLYYLKILKSWDTEKKIKRAARDNAPKEFDKSVTVSDNVPMQMSPIFEDNFELFMGLICSQYQPKTVLKFNKNEQLPDIQNKSDNNYLFTCERIIQMYWNPKHPFLSILRSSYAKALYKNTNNRKEEAKIDRLFSDAVEIAKDAMGELNVFYGKLTRDVGLFFDKNLKFQKAYNMFLVSYKVFKRHQKIFKKDYFYSLKYLTKTSIYLGRLEEGLGYGKMLVKEISAEKGIAVVDPLKNPQQLYIIPKETQSNFGGSNVNNLPPLRKPNYWEMLHNMTGFTVNLMRIAKYLAKYDTGVEIGNIFFAIIPDPFKFSIKPFKNWLKTSSERVKEMVNLRNEQNNKGEFKYNTEIRLREYEKDYNGKEKKIDNVIKVYLKCLFKGLVGGNNQTYAKAYVSFLEDCRDTKLNKTLAQVNEQFYSLFFRKANETFDEYFKNKILYYLSQKYETEKYNGDELDESFKKSAKELKYIYFKFKDSKLFKN